MAGNLLNTKHGDGNIDNAIQNASSGFIPGQWYLYSENDDNLQSFIDYATQSKLPVIAVGSEVACNHCRAFKTNVLKNKTMTQWLANSNCLLLHCFSATGDWISPVLKLFLNTFVKETGTVLPFICVWKTGKTCFKTTHSTQAYTYYIQEFSKYIDVDDQDILSQVINKLRAPLGSPVVPSQWNGDLDACKEYADMHETPMIAIWSNDHCAHCEILEKPMLSADNLNQYLDQSKFVLCFTCSRDPLGVRMGDEDGNGKYFHFCKGPQKLTNYPFVRFYWYRKNGTQKLVDYSVVGDVVDGQQGIYQNKYEKAGQNIIDYIEKKSGFGEYVVESFPVGEWTPKYRQAKAYAEKMGYPYIAVVSKFDAGCHFCAIFRPKIEDQKFLQWAKSRNVVLGLFKDQSPYDTDKEWVDWVRGDNDGYPVVRFYWKKKDGTVVNDLFEGRNTDIGDYDKDGELGTVNDLIARFTKDCGGDLHHDIKLLSGKNNCTSQTDSDMAASDDVAMGTKRLGNQLFNMYGCASGPEGYNFSGWSSHSNTSKATGPAFGLKTAFAGVKSLAEINGRPMFIIYGKAHNKGSCAFNASFNLWERAGNHTLVEFGKCQTDSFDPSLQKGNFGFYFVYYFNDKDETCTEANEVKQFIMQFGSIPTGYPWYCAYCKRADGSIYARYGSLPSVLVNPSSTMQEKEEKISPIYVDFGDFARKIGQEIQYVWTNGHQEQPITYMTFQISFDLSGGSGYLKPLEVTTASNESFTSSAILPSKSQVEAAARRDGYEPTHFTDDFGDVYKFGSEIVVDDDKTLFIAWAETKKEDSEHKKPSVKRGQIRSYSTSQFPVWYKYNATGYKASQFSNNISALQVIGEASGGPAGNSATQQLVEVYFNDSTPEIAPSAFMGCQNLAYVDAKNIRSVGDYAFYNCKSLTAADFIGAQNKALTHIGDYAFAGSGIKDLVINLQGSVSDSSTNSHCFADCRDLTSVNITNSTYLADHMFDGCSQLQYVQLNNYHSYINNYAFANCPMLTSITFPSKTYMLPDHMFDGCSNLREVKFQEPSDLKYLGEAVFANCHKLTSITLPKSVDSLEYIDPMFLSGSSVDRIVFSGISDDVFVEEVQKEIEVSFSPHKWYSSPGSTIKSILNTCHEKHLPVVINEGNSSKNCSHCRNWWNNVVKSDAWAKWFPNSKYYFFHGLYTDARDGYKAIDDFIIKHTTFPPTTAFPYIYLYWNKLNDDGTTTVIAKSSNGRGDLKEVWGNPDPLIKLIDQTFAGFEGAEAKYEIRPDLTTFGRGDGVEVVFVSSTGKEYRCINDLVVYTPETRVDHYTTSNFKYGIWYGNIRELRAFADENHLPLLLEFGSRGCDPCRDFKINTFNNQDFQEQIAQKPCLLAKVEIGDGQSFDYPTTTQEFYASHEIGDPKTYIPQLVYYWSKADGSTYREIWNYNYRSDPGNANYQTVLDKLDKMLGNYSGDPQYLPPVIETYLDGRYRHYASDADDDIGQFFICDQKTMITSFYQPRTQLSIVLEQATQGAGATLVIDYLSAGTQLVLGDLSAPDGAYQYFTVDQSSRYTDLSGVIFTMHDGVVDNLLSFENEIGSTYTSDQEQSDAGYWTRFIDSSTVDSFQAKIESCQATSTPILIYERPNAVEAIVQFAPKDGGGASQTQTFLIDIEDAKSQSDIEAAARSAIGQDYVLQSISNLDELLKLQSFNTQVKHSAAFLTWAKKKNLVLVDAASSSWSVGAPAKIRQFEVEVQFHGNQPTDPLPKMLVYHACSTCTIDGSILISTRRKIDVDLSKSLSYYTGLIGTYLEEVEQ